MSINAKVDLHTPASAKVALPTTQDDSATVKAEVTSGTSGGSIGGAEALLNGLVSGLFGASQKIWFGAKAANDRFDLVHTEQSGDDMKVVALSDIPRYSLVYSGLPICRWNARDGEGIFKLMLFLILKMEELQSLYPRTDAQRQTAPCHSVAKA
jgi:hypothetical protein